MTPELLSQPFTSRQVFAPLERLRQTLLAAAHADTTQAAAHVVRRVAESDLRGLFPALQKQPPQTDGANTGELITKLDKYVPIVAALEKAVLGAKVTAAEWGLLQTFLNSALPTRRLVGYCALVCLCAVRRSLVT